MVLDGEVGDDGWERVCGLSIKISDDGGGSVLDKTQRGKNT